MLAAGSTAWATASDGAEITEGDAIRTTAGAVTNLIFRDGSVLILQPGTQIIVSRFSLEISEGEITQRFGRVVLLGGTLAFDITSAPFPPSVFEFQTGLELVIIKGTLGLLGYNPKPAADDDGGDSQLKVAVSEGNVSVVKVSLKEDSDVAVDQAADADTDDYNVAIYELTAGKSLTLATSGAKAPASADADDAGGGGGDQGPDPPPFLTPLALAVSKIMDSVRVIVTDDEALQLAQNTNDIGLALGLALQNLRNDPAKGQAAKKLAASGFFETLAAQLPQGPDGPDPNAIVDVFAQIDLSNTLAVAYGKADLDPAAAEGGPTPEGFNPLALLGDANEVVKDFLGVLADPGGDGSPGEDLTAGLADALQGVFGGISEDASGDVQLDPAKQALAQQALEEQDQAQQALVQQDQAQQDPAQQDQQQDQQQQDQAAADQAAADQAAADQAAADQAAGGGGGGYPSP